MAIDQSAALCTTKNLFNFEKGISEDMFGNQGGKLQLKSNKYLLWDFLKRSLFTYNSERLLSFLCSTIQLEQLDNKIGSNFF
jgi:hypothetical protein